MVNRDQSSTKRIVYEFSLNPIENNSVCWIKEVDFKDIVKGRYYSIYESDGTPIVFGVLAESDSFEVDGVLRFEYSKPI